MCELMCVNNYNHKPKTKSFVKYRYSVKTTSLLPERKEQESGETVGKNCGCVFYCSKISSRKQ